VVQPDRAPDLETLRMWDENNKVRNSTRVFNGQRKRKNEGDDVQTTKRQRVEPLEQLQAKKVLLVQQFKEVQQELIVLQVQMKEEYLIKKLSETRKL
jgi:hypothetical protein